MKHNSGGSVKVRKVLPVLVLVGTWAAAQVTPPITIPPVPFALNWENTPKSYSFRKDVLQIEAGDSTDMFRDPNVTYNTDTAPKLAFHPDDNFVLSASISHDFVSKWDGGALFLKADSLNWIKFCFEKDYTGSRRVVSVVTKGVSDDCNSVAIRTNNVYYKMAKAGNVITLYYSEDGRRWFLVRHVQFNCPAGFTIGFLAQSPVGKSCRVSFGDIRYSAKRISDPYSGE
jgi:uncharacterized protein